MKVIVRFVLSSIFFIGVISLQAQESLVLSLDSAISFAIKHNKTLINSRYAIDKTTQRVNEAIAIGLPQINASVDYSNYLGATASLQLSDLAPPATIEFNPTSNLKASVSQLVFNGSFLIGVQMAKLARQITGQSYTKDELDVKEQTIQAYYLILATERNLGTIRENKANVQLIYEKTNNLVNAGILEETDLKKLSVMVTSVDIARKSMERQLELGYNLLRLQLGLESGQAVRLTSTLDGIADQYIFHVPVAGTFNIQNNVDYQLVLLNNEMARKNINLRKSAYLPSLSAYYSYNEKLLKPIFDMSPKHVVGFSLNVPVFSGGQRYSQLQQAKIEYEMSENSRDLLSQKLTIQERQLQYNFQNLLEQYLNQKTNTEVSREVLNKMELKYNQGVVSTLELTSANSDYLNAESSYTTILLQLMNAELTLRKTNNKL